MAENDLLKEGLERFDNELILYLDSLGKLTDEEKSQILSLAKSIEQVARAEGILRAMTSLSVPLE